MVGETKQGAQEIRNHNKDDELISRGLEELLTHWKFKHEHKCG